MKKIILLLVFISASILAQVTKIELPTADNSSSFTVTGTDADRKMKFFADGGFYLTGENSTGTIPISGPGGRLMWFPGRRAFRVGSVDGAYWDLENIGRYSIATGVNTIASGEFSSAMGKLTTASGEASTAMGYNTTAKVFASVAIGRYNIADGNATNWVSSDPLFICGNGNSDIPSNALTLYKNGNMTIAGSVKSESGGFIFPDGSTQTTAAVTVNSYWRANGNNLYNTNSGKVGINISSPAAQLHINGTDGLLAQGSYGNGATLNLGAGTRLHWYSMKAAFRAGYVSGTQWDDDNIGEYSFASGKNTTASGDNSIAIGNESIASGNNSIAIGNGSIASGENSVTLGRKLINSTSDCTVVGKFNKSDVAALFIVGCGAQESTRFNAFQVDYDSRARFSGNVTISGDLIANDLWSRFNGGGTEYRLYASLGLVGYTIGSFSDSRLKENVATIASPLQKIQKLRGVTYNWNSTAKDMFINELRENVRSDQSLPEAEQEKIMQETVDKKLEELSKTEISFIAQEVEEIFPEWVHEDENGYKKIDMKGLNGLLVEAVKELKMEKDKEISELKRIIKEMKKDKSEADEKNVRLEKRLAKIEEYLENKSEEESTEMARKN